MLHHATIPRPLRWVASVATAALFGSLLSIAVAAPVEAAPPASQFDPGLIISDSVMFDYGTMTEDDIQKFLDLKVPTCSASASQPCLKDYTADTHTVAPVANRCLGGITGASAVPAARIIQQVAVACSVNPKVLLVTLQKEQGLVTSTSPTATKYRIAMGYGCPDTAACNSTYYGFFNQVYQAAYAFNKYTKSPEQYTAYQPGSRKIGYNPKSSCGTATVNIRSKATGALYFYTPYVPNTAALANLYGTGDSCSSYGNRNFWRYFNDWFGSPVGGSFIIDTDDGHTYALISGVKWEIPRSGLLATLAPLGKTGRVSDAYADGFPLGGTLGNLVSDSRGGLYLLDNGRKLTLSDCVQAADFGFPCAGAVPMSDDILAYFPTQGALTNVVTTATGAGYVLGAGAKREVLDAASATAENIVLAAPSASVLDDTLVTVPYGMPIARRGVLVALRGSTDSFFITTTTAYRMSSALLTQTRLSSRLGAAVGTLDAGSFAVLAPQVAFTGLFTESATGVSYLVTKSGKATVTNPAKLGGTFVAVDPEFAALIPASGQSVTAPTFLKDLKTGVKFLVSDAKRRPATTSKALKALAKKVKIGTAFTSVASETLAATGKPFVAPATILKSSATSTVLWFIDGASKKRPVSKSQAKELTGSTKAKVVPQSTIDGFTTIKGAAKPGLTSGGIKYLADGGVLRVVSTSDAKRFGSKYGFGSYDATTIAALKKGVAIGRVIKVGSKYYEVKNAKKVRISAATAKRLAASTGKKAQAVSSYFGSQLATK